MPRFTLRLRIRCPKCGAPPAVQVYREQIERYNDDSPDEPVLSVQCQRKTCGEFYDVTAIAFQKAS